MKRKPVTAGLFLAVLVLLFAFSASRHTRSVSKRPFGDNPVGKLYIIVDKSDYELRVYDEQGWFATYPVVFGSKSLDDKMMEGDRKTPEGSFTITGKRPHNKWHKILPIDYPNKESWEKFRRRKAAGLIPASARIGGGIALHGTWPNDDIVVNDYTNWTQGCISLRNEDIDDLYSYVGTGTTIIIRR